VKNLLYIVVGILVFPMVTFADTITNINGIEITDEEYANFIKVHTHEYIMTMTEEEYAKLSSLDYSNVYKETKYYIESYNPSLRLTAEREVTKEEYDNFHLNASQNDGNGGDRLSSGSDSTETNAKILTMSVTGGTTYNYASLSASWKYIPNTRSYDVIGYYGAGIAVREGSQTGKQIYTLNGNYTYISYSWNGTNIHKDGNWYGISMNIVDSNISTLQLETDCDFTASVSYPTLYGSYQHATSTVTLSQSHNYTLGTGGLGNVFVFPSNISQKYDGMSGVHVSW